MPYKLLSDRNTQQKILDVRETFILWDILASKYMMMEHLLTWDTIVSDASVKRLIKKNITDISENIDILEKQLEKFIVPTPDKPRAFVNNRGAGTGELISDKIIVMNMFFYNQEHIENMLTGIHRSHTNEELRNQFIKMLKKTTNLLDELILSMQKKGWHSVPPLYKPLPPGTKEELDCGDAANLWDHLVIRYDNLHVSEFMSNLVHDKDFKIMLDMGLSLLTKQITKLENELEYFGISVPERPNDVALPQDLKMNFSDKHFYRQLLGGMHGASLVHAKSYKQSTTNHRVRKLFKDLLMTEVDKIDDILKFGKLKQWLHPVPMYIP